MSKRPALMSAVSAFSSLRNLQRALHQVFYRSIVTETGVNGPRTVQRRKVGKYRSQLGIPSIGDFAQNLLAVNARDSGDDVSH